jgi:Pyridoxamine 5'-phosphate oxidase
MNDIDSRSQEGHPRLDALPEWPTRTIALLATIDEGPFAIPISAPLRAGDRSILFALRRTRGPLTRLRERPQVALTVLTEEDIAFTARGHARIIEEPMSRAPDYAAVVLDVEQIDDHRQEFRVDSGIGRSWIDRGEQRALGERVDALRELAAGLTYK